MTGEHYEEWQLLAYIDAFGDDTLRYGSDESPADLVEIGRHVESCSDCSSRLDQLRSFIGLLSERAVYEEALDVPPAAIQRRLTAVRKMAEQMKTEATQAESTMVALLAIPRDQWNVYLEKQPTLKTGGLVQRLITEARGEYERRPAYALEILEVASAVAERLADQLSYMSEVAKERANALRYLGRYPEALQELKRAEELVVQTPVHGFELAQILRARATLLFYMTRYREALAELGEAVEILKLFGDAELMQESRLLEAAIVHEQGDFAGALRLYGELRAAFATSDDVTMRARIEGNLAECSTRIRRFTDARAYATRAIALYDHVGNATERARVEWTIAYTDLREGNLEQAEAALAAVRSRFVALGMRQEAAEILLDLVEIHVAREEWSVAATLAARALEGLIESECPVHVANAVAHLREVVGKKQASPALVRYVRDFVLAPAKAPFVPPASAYRTH